jgi:hypothetical protein
MEMWLYKEQKSISLKFVRMKHGSTKNNHGLKSTSMCVALGEVIKKEVQVILKWHRLGPFILLRDPGP